MGPGEARAGGQKCRPPRSSTCAREPFQQGLLGSILPKVGEPDRIWNLDHSCHLGTQSHCMQSGLCPCHAITIFRSMQWIQQYCRFSNLTHPANASGHLKKSREGLLSLFFYDHPWGKELKTLYLGWAEGTWRQSKVDLCYQGQTGTGQVRASCSGPRGACRTSRSEHSVASRCALRWHKVTGRRREEGRSQITEKFAARR